MDIKEPSKKILMKNYDIPNEKNLQYQIKRKNGTSPADIGVILVGPRFGVHTKCFDIFG